MGRPPIVKKKEYTVSNQQTEKELTELQVIYLQTRDEDTFQKMFSILYPYSRSKVLKTTAGKKYLEPDLVDAYAAEATMEFLGQYDKPKFRVETSFGGLLGLKVLEVMYGPKIIKADQIGSLNEHLENGTSKVTELGDLQESLGFTFLWQGRSEDRTFDPSEYIFDKNEDVITSVMTTFKDLFKSCPTKQFMRVCVGVLHFIKKKRGYEKYRERVLSVAERKTLDLVLLEIMNRLKQVG